MPMEYKKNFLLKCHFPKLHFLVIPITVTLTTGEKNIQKRNMIHFCLLTR